MSEDDEKPPLDAALRHLAEQQRRSLTSHPPPQELAAYHAGELPPEAEARILDHLAVCRECSDLLLDLSGFADLKPPAGVPELTDAQVEQDWQALRAKMRTGEGGKEEERRPAAVVPIRPAGPAPRPERTYSPFLPVAASLLAVIGLSFGIYQKIQVEKLLQPSVSQVVYFNTTRSDSEESRQLASGVRGELVVPVVDGFSSYRVEIRDENDKVHLSLGHKSAGPIDGISIDLPPGYLRSGDYKIYLYGIGKGRDEEIADYDFEVK